MKHETKILRKGSGITEEMKPACSCGWEGIGYEAHNDWQHTLVDDQIKEHLKKARHMNDSMIQ